MNRLPIRHAALIAGLCAAPVAAQGLVASQGVIVATDGDLVPNASGVPLPGLAFGGANALADNPVVDETGRLLFRARITGGTQTTTTERAFFYGSSRTDLRMVVRGGDPAPGLPNGIVLANAGGAVSAFASAVRLSADGRMMWCTYLADPVNGSVDFSNDEAMFGGAFGAQTLLVRRGDAAPGTIGASFVSAFTSPNVATSGQNREGRIHFHGSLTGGDVVVSQNQGGIWSGFPGALELVARRGSPVSGIAGAQFVGASNAFGSVGQMNDSGRLLYLGHLSTTAGANPATDADDTVLFVHTPGAGSTVLVREGSTVPGTSGATFNTSFGDDWTPDLSPNAWTRTGETIFETELRGGDAIADLNDRALCRAGSGAPSLVARRGSPAVGTDALYEDWNPSSLAISISGRVAFQATIQGGTSTPDDDTGLWTGNPGALQLVLREGTVMPGTGGSTAGNINGGQLAFNDLGQLLFPLNLVGGTLPGNSLWVHDPALGLVPIVLPGDALETSPTVFKPITSFSWVVNNDGAGAALGFTHDGRVALRVGFSDGKGAIVTLRVPVAVTPNTPYCFGDGTGGACPCGNVGSAGRGCASSVQPAGALLAASGWARIGVDTLRLAGSGMPNAPALYFQGTTQQSGGLGVAFGDGLRCAGGTIVRLATRTNVAGASAYPNTGDPRISVRGMVLAPGTRTYQVWYRNAASFCTTSTFNLSNGVQVVWFS